jgi:NAD(P)-dependent dehydrogenase (short-subunit alcohol dehydrogenase family)
MGDDRKGQVAVVTGASRGAGRGIALVLGEAGATVYVTGRSARGSPTTEGLPGTVEETAELVDARGGRGVAVRCDHTSETEVRALFDRVRDEQGRLDLLVNNVWGGYERHARGLPMAPFWKLETGDYWAGMFEAGLRAHFLASRFAAPLILPQKRGLVVNTVAWLGGAYLANIYYDVAKSAIIRMAQGMAHDLKPHGIAAVALAPGFIRTERVMAAHAGHPFDLSATESPEYIGRAVLALWRDPDLLARTGQALTVGDLAREYGFTDVDGRQIPPFVMPG